MESEFKCIEQNCQEKLSLQNYLIPLERCQHFICLSHMKMQLQQNGTELGQFISVLCSECNQTQDVAFHFISKFITINQPIFDKTYSNLQVQQGNLLNCSKHNKKIVMKSQEDDTLACTTCLKSLDLQDFEDFENEQLLDHFKKFQLDISIIKEDTDKIFFKLQNIIEKKIILNEQSFKEINDNAKNLVNKFNSINNQKQEKQEIQEQIYEKMIDNNYQNHQKVFQEQLNQKLQNFEIQNKQNKFQEEINEKIGEDDWNCENCTYKNKMDINDIKSCYCKACNQKNINIEFIIKSKQDEQKLKFQEKHMNAQQQNNLENDDIYHKKGEYFQCRLCDQYSVHQYNDTQCMNHKCDSNIKKVQSPPINKNLSKIQTVYLACNNCYQQQRSDLIDTQTGLCQKCLKIQIKYKKCKYCSSKIPNDNKSCKFCNKK